MSTLTYSTAGLRDSSGARHAGNTLTRSVTGPRGRTRIRSLLLRRIWLPAPLYRALPGLYLVAGLTALATGLFAPEPHWLWGYLTLPGIGLVHGSLALLEVRRRQRRYRRTATRLPGNGSAAPGLM